MFIFGIAEFAQMYFDRQTLQSAVETAGRLISTTPNVTQSQLASAVHGALGTLINSDVTVSYSVTTLSGVSVGHLSSTMTSSYTIPFVTTYNMTYTADTYVPPAS